MIQPAAEIILKTWNEPKKFLSMSSFDIQKTIDDANHLMGLLNK